MKQKIRNTEGYCAKYSNTPQYFHKKSLAARLPCCKAFLYSLLPCSFTNFAAFEPTRSRYAPYGKAEISIRCAVLLRSTCCPNHCIFYKFKHPQNYPFVYEHKVNESQSPNLDVKHRVLRAFRRFLSLYHRVEAKPVQLLSHLCG